MASPLTVWSSTDDGYMRKNSASYSTARGSGSAQFSSAGTSYLYVGQDYTTEYYCYESLLGFDTSSIGGSSSVTSAVLSLWCGLNYSTTDFVINARINANWPPSVAADDWVGGDALDTYTLVAHKTTTGISTSAYTDLTDDALAANVVKTSTTYLMLNSDRQEDTGGGPYTPTGNEYVCIYSANDDTGGGGTDRDPKLYVEYTEGDTFTGMRITRHLG